MIMILICIFAPWLAMFLRGKVIRGSCAFSCTSR